MRIIARLNIGGPALHVTHLARDLNPARFETMLVTGQISPTEGDMSDLAAGLNWQVVPSMGRAVSPLADAATLLKLWSLIRQYRPHIVHTHTAKAGAVGRLAAWLAGVPIVLHTFHGHTFSGYWGWVGSRLAILAEQFLSHFASRVVVVSDRLRDDLIRYGIAPAEKIGVVPLGLDLEPFAAQTPDPNATDVGIVGRLVPVKNHRLYLQMAQRMIADGFEGRFVIVGDGELRAALEREAAELGERLEFTGWRRDLPGVYAKLAVVVSTSLNEGTPVSLIEAMAAGVPVVATAVGGVPDVIRHGETGWLAAGDDVAALAERVRWAVVNRQARDVAARARPEVLQRFSKLRLLKDMEALYDSLLLQAKIEL